MHLQLVFRLTKKILRFVIVLSINSTSFPDDNTSKNVICISYVNFVGVSAKLYVEKAARNNKHTLIILLFDMLFYIV